MKPKIFIGSSVEGLGVAYAIQQNLIHNAEVTVWDQGVFELSDTTIESLEKALKISDYGIFVFSPDDIAKIRKDEYSVVRDNVILEYGLFVGKLGRERVFFVKPMDAKLHLPTDLMGITPGNYENNREDKSLQAGTGVFSNQVREKIKKLGRLHQDNEISEISKKEETNTPKDNEWYHDFDSGNFSKAKTKLNKILRKLEDTDEIIKHTTWIAYCEFKVNEKEGLILLNKILTDFPDNPLPYYNVARVFMWADYFDKCLDICGKAINKFENNHRLKILKSDCLNTSQGADEAIEFLKSINKNNDIEISLKLIEILKNEKKFREAKNEVHKIYQEYPNNEEIKYQYAIISKEIHENNVALYLFNSLTLKFPKKSNYWGYLSNACVHLDFYDLALSAKRKAEKITDSKEEWILSNIANMFKTKGFYSEAIEYFEKSLKIDKESEYAHEHMAQAIKYREKQRGEIEKAIKKGKKQIREYSINESNEFD